MRGLLLVFGVLVAAGAWGVPLVDGKVTAGEYAHSVKVLDDGGTVSWSYDAQGGLSVAFQKKAKGWIAVGLGAKRMSGAELFLGFVGADGKPVFAEQAGKGHKHSDPAAAQADQHAVAVTGGQTVVEIHLPAAAVKPGTVPFIVAYSDKADLVTFHEDNFDTGSLTLP